MEQLERESYPAGSFIFLEGDTQSHFYIIETGQIEIFTQTKDGQHHLGIATFGPGESFGEFALLAQTPRSASARAVTDVDVIKVSEAAYERLVAELPEWASSMLRSFVQRLKTMNIRFKDVPQFLPKNRN